MSRRDVIPAINRIADPNIRNVLLALKEVLEVGIRQRGEVGDSFLRVSDLVNIGLLGVGTSNTLYDPNAPAPPPFLPDPRPFYIDLLTIDGRFVVDNEGARLQVIIE